jgi:hypothetical protein
VAATTNGLSRFISALTTATAFDPVDALGTTGLDKSQGLWLLNTDGTNIAYLNTFTAATVNGDDCIPLVPRLWTWVVKPSYRKGTPPVITQAWSLISATAACAIMVVSDNGSWHPGY